MKLSFLELSPRSFEIVEVQQQNHGHSDLGEITVFSQLPLRFSQVTFQVIPLCGLKHIFRDVVLILGEIRSYDEYLHYENMSIQIY